MRRQLILAIAGLGVLGLIGTAHAAQSLLKNGSMEAGPGPFAEDPRIPADWTRVGSVIERSGQANLEPSGGGFSLKAFRSQDTESAYQEVAVTAGQQVAASASLFTLSTDKLGGPAIAGIRLQFFNASDQLVGTTHQSFVLNSASPADTWIPATIAATPAPTGAVKARLTCILSAPAGTSGACWWDGASVTINNGPNVLSNGDFETAGVGESSPAGIDDWSGFNDQQQSTDYANDGTHSLKIGT
ncbi:MAG TPA: hypothetical protein P5572_18195, partial [Phycisphaerae bacterium]|nr:hypothetical protein [Phycisphaerae bacterium]